MIPAQIPFNVKSSIARYPYTTCHVSVGEGRGDPTHVTGYSQTRHVIGAEKPIPEEIDHRDDTGANSFQREIVDRAVLSLKDAGVPSFLIE
jgi:hypothetical protein